MSRCQRPPRGPLPPLVWPFVFSGSPAETRRQREASGGGGGVALFSEALWHRSLENMSLCSGSQETQWLEPRCISDVFTLQPVSPCTAPFGGMRVMWSVLQEYNQGINRIAWNTLAVFVFLIEPAVRRLFSVVAILPGRGHWDIAFSPVDSPKKKKKRRLGEPVE